MKIYTKVGDKGETSLVGGKRVQKNHLRVEAYGTVDELISYLGVVRSYDIDKRSKDMILKIQDNLMIIAAILASDGESKIQLPEEEINILEQEIDKLDKELLPLKSFILPGGCLPSAFCHITRSICRKAERTVVSLNQKYEVDQIVLSYLNRLSDYLFTLGRKLSKDYNIEEDIWNP